MPLGAGALAGCAFPIDRETLAADLGFAEASPNSLDAVSDRDFIAEFLFWAALLGIHLSRWAEDLVFWSSREFGFITLADAYSTGSSLMPQKKNPDAAELLRGKAGRLVGGLTALLVTLKGLPSSYDKDLQEDKEPLFDAVNTLSLTLPVAQGILETLTIRPDRMAAALGDELLATDLADWLVRRGVPFRQSHHIVGRVVRRAEELGCTLSALPLAELQAISPVFTADVATVWSIEQSVEQRTVIGGTARAAVQDQIDALTSSVWMSMAARLRGRPHHRFLRSLRRLILPRVPRAFARSARWPHSRRACQRAAWCWMPAAAPAETARTWPSLASGRWRSISRTGCWPRGGAAG